MRGLKQRIRNYVYRPNRNALLILGFPKSGTSVITGLLAARSNKSVMIDSKYLWEPYLSDIKNGSLDFKNHLFKKSFPFSKEIIKEPNMVFLLEFLEDVFDMNKIIIIRRDPLGNIKSILDRLGISGDLKVDEELPDTNIKWRKFLLSGKGNNYVERIAYKWKEANSELLALENRFSVHYVDYEKFIQNKQKTIDDILIFMNWEKKGDISSLLNKAYQPISKNRDITMSEFFGNNLESVKLILNIK